MREIFRINFIIFLFLFISENSFAESKLEKIKDKVKASEDKLIGKIWGAKDCSLYSTKTFADLAAKIKCKRAKKN